jgi:hypothetical protein
MSDSKIRFNAIQEPVTPAANRVWLWYDEDDQIFKIKRDNGIAEPLVGGSVNLNSLSDVTISDPQDGDVLVYDAALQKWKNSSLVIPPSNIYTVEYFTLDALNVSSSSITLSHTPTDASAVTMDVISGSAQIYGEDYFVTANVLSWDTTPLYGILDVGDKIRVTYTR